MAQYIRILGRAAGQAFKSQAIDRAITVTTEYIFSEMRLTDVRAKRVLLKRKRANHLGILGRTIYRLMDNGIEPMGDDRTLRIIRVIQEIDGEISDVEEELERRKAYEMERRKAASEKRARRKTGTTPTDDEKAETIH